ncbi:MAG: YgfZ/GcvT domain-containing protein [Actinomycetota bacterium]
MSHCQAALLADRAVLRVTGTDARKFLQGMLTNDVGKLADGQAMYAGLLAPQGKILFELFVVAAKEDFLIDVAKDRLAELIKRLGFYRLRSKVEMKEEPDLAVAAVWGGSPRLPDGAIAYPDPRLATLGLRALLPGGTNLSELACTSAAEADYHAMRIKLGVPEGGRDYSFGDTFPHEALFDQLNGVDFKKGCYVGQELVSRMEHRGLARKRIVPIEGEAELPPSGTQVTAGGVPIGTIGSSSGTSGLALIRLDRAEEALAKGSELKVGEVKITLRQPEFARFLVPVTALSA